MDVFISWSGTKSKLVAEALRSWLQDVIQLVRPWVSSEDIRKGARWLPDIGKQLETSRFGVLCVTRENVNEPWINFEAGALAKSFATSAVVPYLLDMEPSELVGPLAQFQAARANREDTRKLIGDINDALKDARLDNSRLTTSFDRCWADLEGRLTAAKSTKAAVATVRSTEEIMGEVLDVVRFSSQQLGQLEMKMHVLEQQVSPSPFHISPFVQTPFGTVVQSSLPPGEWWKTPEAAAEAYDQMEKMQKATERLRGLKRKAADKESDSTEGDK